MPSPSQHDRYVAYGVGPQQPARPFNRADYYVKRVANTTALRCAPGTGTLFKGVANHADNNFTRYAVMDCVANVQIAYRLDTNGDGIPDETRNELEDTSGTPLTPLQIKERVKEIQVYLLAHEGGSDKSYKQSGNGKVVVGPDTTVGFEVDLAALAGADWARYRWKTYTLFIKPRSFY